MKYYTYILYSPKFDKYYYGQTSDLSLRLLKHNKGEVASTKRYIPWQLFAYLELDTRSEAMKIERKLKNLRSRNRVKEFIEKNHFTIVK